MQSSNSGIIDSTWYIGLDQSKDSEQKVRSCLSILNHYPYDDLKPIEKRAMCKSFCTWRNPEGKTVLHLAVLNFDSFDLLDKLIKLFKEYSVDLKSIINTHDNEGHTPLDYADHRNTKILNLLMDNGAIPLICRRASMSSLVAQKSSLRLLSKFL